MIQTRHSFLLKIQEPILKLAHEKQIFTIHQISVHVESSGKKKRYNEQE